MKTSGKILYRCTFFILLGSTNIALCGNEPENFDIKIKWLDILEKAAKLESKIKDNPAAAKAVENFIVSLNEEMDAKRRKVKSELERQLEAERLKVKRELEMRLEAERQRDEQLKYTMGSGILLLLFSTTTAVYLNRNPKKNIPLGGIIPEDKKHKEVKEATEFVMKIDDSSLDRLAAAIVEKRNQIVLKVGNQKVIVDLIDSINENDYEEIKCLQNLIKINEFKKRELKTKITEGGFGVQESSFKLELDKKIKEIKECREDLKILISSIIEKITIS